jgi:hypothetical protein
MAGQSQGSKGSKASVVLKVRVSPETAEALRLEALGSGRTLGQVVEGLWDLWPTRYSLVMGFKGLSGAQGESLPFAVVSEEVA